MFPASVRSLYALLILFDVLKHLALIALGPAPICWDARQYFEFGNSVANGDFLLTSHDVNYRVPGYGWFLGAVFAIYGNNSLWIVVVCQHLMSIATAVLTAKLCEKLTRDVRAGLVAYILCMSCISRDWFANTLLNETLFLLLLTIFWWTWEQYLCSPSLRRALQVGATLGLVVLVRPIVQLFWVPVVFTFFVNTFMIKGKLSPIDAFKHSSIVVATFVLIASPWWLRNWSMYDAPFLARLPAENKWQVCFQEGASANLPIPATQNGERLRRLLDSCRHSRSETYCYCVTDSLKQCRLSGAEIDRLVTQLCWEAVREHPVKFGWAWTKRSVNFWRCRRNEFPPWGDGQPLRDHTMQVWYGGSIAKPVEQLLRNSLSTKLHFNEFVILLLAVGIVGLLRRRETWMFGLAACLAFTYFTVITSAVEIENYRYRMVLEPLMIVVVVSGLYQQMNRRHSGLRCANTRTL